MRAWFLWLRHSGLRVLLVWSLIFAGAVGALEISNRLLAFVSERFGVAARDRLVQWQNLTQQLAPMPEAQKLELVNRFFNRAHWVSDLKHWGKEDYWATPVELLVTNAGDCEDYSIAKFYTLKALGIADDKLRVTYVKALNLNQAHMVLTYYPAPDAEPLILDNIDSSIKPASQRPDLAPVYSFNADGLWLNKMEGPDKRIGDAAKLSRWVEVNRRLVDTLK